MEYVDRSNTGLMTCPTYQSTLLPSERAEGSIGRGSPVRAFPDERPNFRLDDASEDGQSVKINNQRVKGIKGIKVSRSKGFKSSSLVDAKVVNDLRTTRSAMAQLTSSHIPQQFIIRRDIIICMIIVTLVPILYIRLTVCSVGTSPSVCLGHK